MKRRRAGSYKKLDWYKRLRERMVRGLEPCRICGDKAKHVSIIGEEGTRIAHIIPHVHGGSNLKSNLTILCGICDISVGQINLTGQVTSLEDEGVC